MGDQSASRAVTGQLHHVEIWVPNLGRAAASWGWLLSELGYEPFQEWSSGRSWRLGSTYLVFEQSPAITATEHDRRRPGVNHLAFHAGDRDRVDILVETSRQYGWNLLFAEQHPYAGGTNHYAAYLTNDDEFQVELVAGTG
jgi:hypothetical protein